jgi:ELWxxDGT repeat protein
MGGRGIRYGLVVIALTAVGAAFSASANGASLVRNIAPGDRSSTPNQFTKAAGTTFFGARDPSHGYELWRTDGTAAGTRRVRDIYPGTRDGLVRPDPDLAQTDNLENVAGTLLFYANDGVHGRELWRSDGTRKGTRLVRDIHPGPLSSDRRSGPTELTRVGRTLFFNANDGTHGPGLWRSDGTRAGTRLVRKIGPRWAGVSRLTNVAGTLFFDGYDSHEAELWRSDGTAAGTRMVRDINPNPAEGGSSSNPNYLTNVAGTLFFTADDGVHGDQLWRSDGTAAGTKLVRQIGPAPGDPDYDSEARPSNLTSVGSTLFFDMTDGSHGIEPWRSDGTASGTRLVRDIWPGFPPTPQGAPEVGPLLPSDLTNVAGTLFFSVYEPTHGWEVWYSDGTWRGTRIVRDVNPATDLDYGRPSDLTAVGRTLFFVADDGIRGYELWRTDGTRAGTRLVRNIHPGSDGSKPNALAGVSGRLFFNADDGFHGRELWKATP